MRKGRNEGTRDKQMDGKDWRKERKGLYRFITGGVSGLGDDNSERFSAIGPLNRGSESDGVDGERKDGLSFFIYKV